MSEPLATLTVDLDALVSNYRNLADRSSPARCAAAVKADAYGLGATSVAQALNHAGCDNFFVATIEEGIALRDILPKADIFVLNGLYTNDIKDVTDHHLIPVLNDITQIKNWERLAAEYEQAYPAAIQLDTGINRLGLTAADVHTLMDRDGFQPSSLNICLLMSHLACASNPDHEMNEPQLQLFNECRQFFPGIPASIANTGGILLGAPYHLHMTRPGIGLYGGLAHIDAPVNYQNVVTLKAKILQVRPIKKGETVGYDATYKMAKDSIIATVGLGYADGYLLGYSNQGYAIINDHRVPVIGRISMDLLVLDVTAIGSDKVHPGMDATFLGDGITLKDAAEWGDMHMYQVLSALGPRVERQYRSKNKTDAE